MSAIIPVPVTCGDALIFDNHPHLVKSTVEFTFTYTVVELRQCRDIWVCLYDYPAWGPSFVCGTSPARLLDLVSDHIARRKGKDYE